jgi:hypothetical protein
MRFLRNDKDWQYQLQYQYQKSISISKININIKNQFFKPQIGTNWHKFENFKL